MRSSSVHRWLWVILTLLVLSLVASQVYKERLMNLIGGVSEAVEVTPPACDLNRGSCPFSIMTLAASETPWMFSISPHPIPVSTPLTLTLTPPPGKQPRAISVDLMGDNMDMGLIRIVLVPTADGRWEGVGSIPICVTGSMRWRARLYLQLEKTRIQADWVFNAPTSTAMHGLDQ